MGMATPASILIKAVLFTKFTFIKTSSKRLEIDYIDFHWPFFRTPYAAIRTPQI